MKTSRQQLEHNLLEEKIEQVKSVHSFLNTEVNKLREERAEVDGFLVKKLVDKFNVDEINADELKAHMISLLTIIVDDQQKTISHIIEIKQSLEKQLEDEYKKEMSE